MSVGPVREVRCWLACDIGKVNDPAALLVLERVRTFTPGPFDPRSGESGSWSVSYGVRFLERLKLGTPYPLVVDRLETVCDALIAQAPVAGQLAELVVDVTGLGRPVFDFIEERRVLGRLVDGERKRLRVPSFVGVSYTSGQVARPAADGTRIYNVPKRDLVARAVLLFQRQELRIAEGLPDAPVLVNELVNFQESLTAAGNSTYGNDGKLAKNDDLVNALALAAWRAVGSLPHVLEGSQRLL